MSGWTCTYAGDTLYSRWGIGAVVKGLDGVVRNGTANHRRVMPFATNVIWVLLVRCNPAAASMPSGYTTTCRCHKGLGGGGR